MGQIIGREDLHRRLLDLAAFVERRELTPEQRLQERWINARARERMDRSTAALAAAHARHNEDDDDRRRWIDN